MPLIIISGHPCIGKTTFATELKRYLEETECSVVLINEESLGISCSTGYSSSFAEKTTRGSIKSAVDHSLSSTAWVIVDSMNYIKGFRYELYCLARTIKSTHCCIWLSCDEGTSDTWSAQREQSSGASYPADVLGDLRRRFEPPNERNRWDRPLFKFTSSASPRIETSSAETEGKLPSAMSGLQMQAQVHVVPEEAQVNILPVPSTAGAAAEAADETVVSSSFRRKGKVSSGASVASTFRRAAQKADPVPEALVFNRLDATAASYVNDVSSNTGGSDNSIAAGQGSSDSSAAVSAAEIAPASASAAELRLQLFARIHCELCGPAVAAPNSSTVKIQHGNADILYELDHVSQLITHAIASHQSGPDMQAGAPLLLPAYARSLELHRTVSLAELQRHRTQFVRLNSKHPPADGVQAGSMFVDFLAVQL